jgi:ABC-type transporter lipoprotein component MlaA
MRSRYAAHGVAAVLLLCFLTAAPAVAQRQDPSREQSNVSVLGVDQLRSASHRETFQMLQYTPDPIEGFNRKSLGFTKGAVNWVMKPIAKGWRFITPTFARRGLDNLFFNLGWPSRFLSLLLQGEIVKSGVETGHFVVNTTIGIAGLFDPASRLGIPTYRQDIGLAFARWGSGPGFYFFIPILGPSSGRDALGRLFDTALHPATYLAGANFFFNMNAFTFRIDGYEALVESYPDPYLPVRALWSIQRTIAVERYTIPPEDYAESDPDPSLGVLLLKTEDSGFPARAKRRTVAMPQSFGPLPYSLWLQDGQAPLVFVIPGIGAHRTSSNPVAIAEMAYQRGHSVAIVSNPFHPEFLLHGLSVPYPGYTPTDSEDLYTALSLIRDDLERRHPGRVTEEKLMGYSLGAIETLFIAGAQESRSADALRFERFVAINPPVDVRHSAQRFDDYFDAPLAWPDGERNDRVKRLAMKAFLVLQEGIGEETRLPFDRAESEFLIGFMGRTMMIDALGAIERKGAPVLQILEQSDGAHSSLLDPINQSSFRRYGDELILPFYRERVGRGVTREDLAAQASLRTHERLLRASDLVHVFTNANDFILGDENLAWLREVAGARLTVFPDGGHLGNLHLEPIQEAILEALDGAPGRPAPGGYEAGAP